MSSLPPNFSQPKITSSGGSSIREFTSGLVSAPSTFPITQANYSNSYPNSSASAPPPAVYKEQPKDILIYIMDFLSPAAIKDLREVNRTWNMAAVQTLQQLPRLFSDAVKIISYGMMGGSTLLVINPPNKSRRPELWVCGNNEQGQLGMGTRAESLNFKCVSLPKGCLPEESQSLKDFEVFAKGNCVFIKVQIKGKPPAFWACGNNEYGQLGIGPKSQKTPRFKQAFTFVRLPAGCLPQDGSTLKSFEVIPLKDHVFIKTQIVGQAPQLWACGNNVVGELGLGDNNNRYTFTSVSLPTTCLPEDVSTLVSFELIPGDHNTFLKVQIQGQAPQLWACGGNEYGQLGLGDNNNRYTFTSVSLPTTCLPEDVSTLESFEVIPVGYDLSFLKVQVRGQVPRLWVCGQHWNGFRWDNSRNIFTPVPFPENCFPTDVSTLESCEVTTSCNRGHLFLKVQVRGQVPKLWVYRENWNGFGLAWDNSRNIFTSVLFPANCFPTDLSTLESCEVLPGDDRVFIKIQIRGQVPRFWAFGENKYGQLGVGDNNSRNASFTPVPLAANCFPTDLSTLESCEVLAKRHNHTFIKIQIRGQVPRFWACGFNAGGQLGLGDRNDRNTFTPVPLPPWLALLNKSKDTRFFQASFNKIKENWNQAAMLNTALLADSAPSASYSNTSASSSSSSHLRQYSPASSSSSNRNAFFDTNSNSIVLEPSKMTIASSPMNQAFMLHKIKQKRVAPDLNEDHDEAHKDKRLKEYKGGRHSP